MSYVLNMYMGMYLPLLYTKLNKFDCIYRRKTAGNTTKTTSSLLGGVVADEASQDNDENYARRVWIDHKHDDPYGRICHGHNAPRQYSSSSTDYSHMFELQCSARAHAHTLSSSEYHMDNPYGCAHRPPNAHTSDARSSEDLSACPIQVGSLNNSPNSPSFATFRAERSGVRSSPNRTANVPVRTDARTFSTFANKNRSLSSVAEVDDPSSPDHQPDVIASNSERIPNTFGEHVAE